MAACAQNRAASLSHKHGGCSGSPLLIAYALHCSLQFKPVEMQAQAVPVCPSGLALLLIDQGWEWSYDLLQRMMAWLERQDIKEAMDLVDLQLDDLAGTEQWSREESHHVCQMQLLCYLALCSRRAAPSARYFR